MMDDKILNVLRESESYISGEELAERLGITRSAVHKHIEKLRAEGYDICAQPHMGYQLVKVPDRLIPQELLWNLRTKVIGARIYSYEKTSSTMDIAHKLAQSHSAEGTCVFAEEQTKGRGRMARLWLSPKGKGIYFSVILYPDILPQEAPKMTFMAAVSVARAIRKAAPIPALIKWPNDILVNGKKVCGILTEMEAEIDRTRYLVLGIGVNVNTDAGHLPKVGSSVKEELGEPCTRSVQGEPLSRVELAKEIIRELDQNYILFNEGGFGRILRLWREYSAMLGSRVRVICHGKKMEGHALDVDETGALLLRLDNGFIEKLLTGDVIIVR